MSILRHLPYAVLSAGLLVAGGASAQSMWSIDQREASQQERIDQGRRNGSLTRGEYYRLDQGQDRIDNYERRARSDGVVTHHERQRLDNMLDRQGRAIHRETHDRHRAEGRGWGDRDGWRHSGWGHNHNDGRRDGWRHNDWRRDGRGHNDGRRDGWNNGRHEGWTRGEHNGWDGNRPRGIERRAARAEHRVDNGRRDGSLTYGEAHRLQHQQNRIDRYEGRARGDGGVSPYERNRINNMQNHQSRDIYNARHNNRTMPPLGSQQGGSRNWGGWQRQPQMRTPAPAPVTQPYGGNRSWGGNNGGGWGMRQASAPAPAPAMNRMAGPSGGGGRRR